MITPHEGPASSTRRQVKALIKKRIRTLHTQKDSKSESVRAMHGCEEAILEEVLRRSKERRDADDLLLLVDACIRESREYRRVIQDRGLKSFYQMRIHVLKSFLLFVRRRLNPRRWLHRRH